MDECENVGKIVMPALRRAVARELVEKYNMRQSAIADLLGVKQASISNYGRRFSSPRVVAMEKFMERRGISARIAKIAASGAPERVIMAAMEGAIAEHAIMEYVAGGGRTRRRRPANFGSR